MILFALTVFAAGCATETRTFSSDVGNALSRPRFGFFIVNYPSERSDSSNGNFYARIRYDDVIFVKTDSGFAAHYQFSISVYSDKELTESQYSKTFDRQIQMPTYERTMSTTTYDAVKDKLTLKPGKYFIVMRLLDLNTNITSSSEIVHTFKDFLRDSVDISDVLLYDRADANGAPVDVVRNRHDSLFAEFYVTSKDVPAKIPLHVIVKSVETPTHLDTTYELNQTSNVQHYRLPIDIAILAPATYDLKIAVKPAEHFVENVKENSSETFFSIPRRTTPSVPVELDREIAPLVYITISSEMDSLKQGTFEEKRKKLTGFWLAKGHGDTAVASAMRKEFYKRVDSTNERFETALTRGWQTDRGRIYILYGPPDQIENHDNNLSPGSFRNSPPYQVWYYYKLKLRFVFLDEFGTGDYRLTTSRQESGSS